MSPGAVCWKAAREISSAPLKLSHPIRVNAEHVGGAVAVEHAVGQVGALAVKGKDTAVAAEGHEPRIVRTGNRRRAVDPRPHQGV